MKQVLIIFAKNEVYGRVKTRLAATTSPELALETYRILLRHTQKISLSFPMHKVVFYSDYIEHDDGWNSSDEKRVQYGEELGQRMRNAFAEVFNEGAEQCVIIGTDCPELSSQLITESFEQLKHFDVVLGPAKDGGYYLLGLKRLNPALSRNIDWSTSRVLTQTLAVCKENKLSVFRLLELADIDTGEDLKNLKNALINIQND